jgi:DNA-binding response OmpR family regulator
MARHSVLIVEDDATLLRGLKDNFGFEGYDVATASDGEAGLEIALSREPDLILLDIMLPGLNGFEVCQRVRDAKLEMPIIMLTAKGQEGDIIRGLNLGADDYVTKPFSIRELMARVKAIFRRGDALGRKDTLPSSEPIRAGGLVIDGEKREVLVDGKKVDLTAKEYDLLEQLARHPGRVYPRAQLLELVWGYTYDGYEHTLVSHVNRLRRKIEKDPSRPRYVATVRGVGYKFAEQEPDGEA